MPERGTGPLPAGDVRHGSLRGFYAGCDEDCCRGAHNRYERRRRKRIAMYGSSGLRVENQVGVTRRINGLLAMGWFAEEIAHEMGESYANHRNRVLEMRRRTWIRPAAWERLCEVFEDMSARIPPPHPIRSRQRTQARRKGWVVPFAWDDLDNPRERSKGTRQEDDVA